jgi:hypothetical protein
LFWEKYFFDFEQNKQYKRVPNECVNQY